MAIGALFGALNTMYSAVSTRSQEIATLRAIGFGSTPVIKDEQVKEYLNPILASEASQEAYLKKNGKMYKYKEKVVHITGYAQ